MYEVQHGFRILVQRGRSSYDLCVAVSRHGVCIADVGLETARHRDDTRRQREQTLFNGIATQYSLLIDDNRIGASRRDAAP